MLPVMAIYINADGYHEVIHTFDSFTRSTLQASLGNLGFSITRCTHQFLKIDDHPIHLTCSKGKISKILQFGYIPYITADDGNLQENTHFEMDFCGDLDHHAEVKYCTQNYIDSDLLKSKYMQDCQDSNNCTINLPDFVTSHQDLTERDPEMDKFCMSGYS